jgi:hypothetical protein
MSDRVCAIGSALPLPKSTGARCGVVVENEFRVLDETDAMWSTGDGGMSGVITRATNTLATG